MTPARRQRRAAPTLRPSAVHRQAGFILTLGIILVLTILVIGSLVGLAALRNGLLSRSARNLILDSDTPVKPIATPYDFGICEEPLILCPDPENGLRALVGVRPDRFTSRNQVFYANTDCSPPAAGACPAPIDCDSCTNCDPVNCPQNCAFTGGGVFLAPPAAGAEPSLPVGYLNGGLDVDGTPARVVYGVGSPSDWATCNPGVTPSEARLPCADGGVLYRGGGAVAATAIQSVWTSLAPDCGYGGIVSDPAGPVPILAAWAFDSDTADPTFEAAIASASMMTAGNLPASPPDAPGYAQIGSTPSDGCGCAAAVACVCDGAAATPSLSSYFDYTIAGTATAADAGPATSLTDAGATFTTVPEVGATASNLTDGGSGVVTAVNSATNLTHAALSGGTNDDWEIGDSYEITGTNSYLEFSVSCLSGTLSAVSVRLNARRVDAAGLETGELHVLSSTDGFATVSVDASSGAIGQSLADTYSFALGSPGTASLAVRIHPERTGGSQTRFDVRLDNVTFSGFCGATPAVAGIDGVCINTAQIFDLVEATGVETAGVNVLAGYVPLFGIAPATLTFTPAALEGVGPVLGPDIGLPSPPIFTPPAEEGDGPVTGPDLGAPPAQDFPDAEPEDPPA